MNAVCAPNHFAPLGDSPARLRPAAVRLQRWALLALLGLCAPLAARAQDPENCLSCHRFRGLSRLDPTTNELRLFFCNAEFYVHRQGPHARLRCTACHERSEVSEIPHHVQTRVDCSRTCHIAPAMGTELRFSHQRVSDSLTHSAHAADKLANLPFEEPLLRPGQSTCLYCHDEPAFGTKLGVAEGFETHRGGTRCDTCHSEELPLDVTYFSKHVSARMKPLRSVRQLVQVCAVCHSNQQIIAQIGSHDVVASYLHSFHGKASLLGSQRTATCVDCHSSQSGDQHLLLAKTEPNSSINPKLVADTCRTTQCHPGAPPEMSSAAVHLELDPAKRPPEFYVAAFFILMTAGVMTVFFLLIILELVNAAGRRADPEHHRLVRLAKLLLDHPQGRKLLQRMSVHQRLQHWGLVITFALLVFTGMPIKFADTGWAERVISLFGGLAIARVIHRAAGVGLIVVFLYHIGYLSVKFVETVRRDRREGRRTPIWKIILNSPMVLNLRDLKEAGQLFGHLLFLRRHRPHFGQFNFTQKFEYWAVFWGVPVMGLSGIALWNMPAFAEYLTGRAVNFAFIIHSDEAFLAFIYIATVHLFGVIFAPGVFPLSLGTLSGQAPALEIAEAHRGDLERIASEVGVILPHDDHPHHQRLAAAGSLLQGFVKRVYSVALMGGYGFLAYATLRFLLLMLLTKQSAPVEVVDIPKRLDARTYFASAAARTPENVPPERRPRGPLAHFHQIPQWFQPDTGNTCTTSGCHTPLPHGQHVAVRAFLNMHATFLDCTTCHAEAAQGGGQPQWLALGTRRPTQTPAILRLATLVESLGEPPESEAPAINDKLIALLSEALPASGENQELADWLLRLKTANPRSRLWRSVISELRLNIGMHVHGEYAAKIGLYKGGQLAGSPTPEQQAATKDYLRGKNRAETERKALLGTVHKGILPTGAMCTPCHSATPTLVDLGTLGYSPQRVEALRNNAIMRSILSIEQGQPFYLPLNDEEEK